jgi:hypothetical protein
MNLRIFIFIYGFESEIEVGRYEGGSDCERGFDGGVENVCSALHDILLPMAICLDDKCVSFTLKFQYLNGQ